MVAPVDPEINWKTLYVRANAEVFPSIAKKPDIFRIFRNAGLLDSDLKFY
jgi:hypothetical protein